MPNANRHICNERAMVKSDALWAVCWAQQGLFQLHTLLMRAFQSIIPDSSISSATPFSGEVFTVCDRLLIPSPAAFPAMSFPAFPLDTVAAPPGTGVSGGIRVPVRPGSRGRMHSCCGNGLVLGIHPGHPGLSASRPVEPTAHAVRGRLLRSFTAEACFSWTV